MPPSTWTSPRTSRSSATGCARASSRTGSAWACRPRPTGVTRCSSARTGRSTSSGSGDSTRAATSASCAWASQRQRALGRGRAGSAGRAILLLSVLPRATARAGRDTQARRPSGRPGGRARGRSMRQGTPLLVLAPLLASGAGCSADFYERQADRTVAGILEDMERTALGSRRESAVVPAPRAEEAPAAQAAPGEGAPVPEALQPEPWPTHTLALGDALGVA